MKKLVFAIFAVVGLSSASCGEADKLFDCQTVCDRYKGCFDSSYDVGACRNKCKAKADADRNFQTRADTCEKCIDDKSCTAATFKCATECAGVVPQ